MTSTPHSAGSPRELVASVRDLTRQVRVAQRGTWFPLLVLAAVNVAAAPVYRFAPHHLGSCRVGAQGISVCSGYIPAVLIFWPTALTLAYVLIARFYVNQSRRRGIGARVRPYVITGVLLAGVLAAASLWRALHPLPLPSVRQASTAHPTVTLLSFVTPATAIGLALLVLAWVEANRLLAAFSVVFLGLVVAQASVVIHSPSHWYFLPQLLVPAAILVIGAGGFAVLRPARPRS